MKNFHQSIAVSILTLFILSACQSAPAPAQQKTDFDITFPEINAQQQKFGSDVTHKDAMDFEISPDLAANFSLDEAVNLKNIEEDFGISLSDEDRAFLEENKFLIKDFAGTNIEPRQEANTPYREFLALYNDINGGEALYARKLSEAVFWSADIFMHSYQLLYTELLKEIENTIFFPNIKELSARFYEEASHKLQAAKTDGEKIKWMKVRNYFAVPHAIFETAQPLPSVEDYRDKDEWVDPYMLMEEYREKDKGVDTKEKVMAFVEGLGLDKESHDAVMQDIETIYKAEGKGVPQIFADEYKELADETGINFQVDFTQFTPRSHYTGLSLRRQYFRGMKWYIDTPFFVRSPALTDYAFGITQLLAENEKQLQDYSQLESTINYLVGSSDDLMPFDYIRALQSAKEAEDKEKAIMEFLAEARNPRIKSLAATFSQQGEFSSTELKLGTKGMRFFSGKFIIDSYWTDYLTQGDESIQPGYTQKLPPMASSLEVMGLLGSDYARKQIPQLDFYKPETREAIDQAMRELAAENAEIGDDFWQENVYNGWLWVIKALFDWQAEHKAQLPAFMQSPKWDIKTLMTASGFWTELRHATLLYAKQSFAEMGAGFPPCDSGDAPEPPRGYIEPDFAAYNRLLTLAKRTRSGLTAIGYEMSNMPKLDAYIETMETVLDYTKKELQNSALTETLVDDSYDHPDEADGICHSKKVESSDWETIRLSILEGLERALPDPADGPILSAKDARSALVADVHTGGDSDNPTRILYEGTGVPKLILVAVKDNNGPRVTIGFTYSHYEFTEEYGGQRLTDEEWQKNFYSTEDQEYIPFEYTDNSTWPEPNFWYEEILQ